ncbi:anti-repressor protein [Bartonella tribocorum]|nr:anti-repressor protein [Bartonella tribocorum]
MNTLIKITENVANDARAQTMSSIEIAEVCSKKHKNVLHDIKQIFSELKFEPAKFLSSYIDEQGKTRPCYNLPFQSVNV